MAHTFAHILVHVVFSTKQRRPVLQSAFRDRLFAYMGGILRDLGAKPLMINGTSDHVHMLFSLPSTKSIAETMQLVKGRSTRWIHEQDDRSRSFAWQTGYASFSVSHSNLTAVRRYIADQEEHHRRVSFEDEFVSLLKKNEMEFDERYLWG